MPPGLPIMFFMSTSLIRRIVVPASAGALFVLAACSPQVGELQRYGPDDYVAITQPGNVKPATAIEGDDKATGQLIGPHYSLQLAGYTVSEEVPADQVERYGFDRGPVTANKGTEFFLGVMASQTKADPKANAVLDVNGKQTPLDHVPDAGEAIAAVIPTDAPVKLSVTDEDRTQTLDLRDGTRSDEIAGFYTGKTTSKDLADYSEKGKATGDAGGNFVPVSRNIKLTMSVGAATRSPWDADKGWADDGKVWIKVPVSELTTDSVWGFDTSSNSHEPIMNWTLKERDMFSLTPKGGKAVDPQGKTTFKADDSRNPSTQAGDIQFDPASTDLVFQVPDKTTTATLKISPGGSMKAKWSDVSGKCTWDSKPDTKKLNIEF